MRFIDEAGNPLQLYRDFRSESTFPSKSIGIGVKNAYSALFARDKDIHNQDETTIKGHVMAVTDKGENSSIVRLSTQTFIGLCKLAEFISEKQPNKELEEKQLPEIYKKPSETQIPLTYTIVLNLPTTTTKEVYDTIFASLKENLLNK